MVALESPTRGATRCAGASRSRTDEHRRGAHDRRLAVRLGRPGRSGPSGSSHAQYVPETPARGHRRSRPRPRPARQGPARPGLDRRPDSRSAGDREGPRHGRLRDLRPAFRSRCRLAVHRHRDRDAAGLGRIEGRGPRRGRGGHAHRRRTRPHDSGGASPDPGRSRPPPLVAPCHHGARRRLGPLLGVRGAARLRRAVCLGERRHPRRRRGARGARRHQGSRGLRGRAPA